LLQCQDLGRLAGRTEPDAAKRPALGLLARRVLRDEAGDDLLLGTLQLERQSLELLRLGTWDAREDRRGLTFTGCPSAFDNTMISRYPDDSSTA
jgi:hypothetical protein